MSDYGEFVAAPPGEPPVRGFLHSPAASGGDSLILTHGAGANANAPLLVALANAFCASGLMVLRCDLPFRQARQHGPPPRGSAERDQAGLRTAVVAAREHTSGRVFLGGHSYGGRQASMLAAAEPGLVDRLLLLSYPLHPPQRPSELRTAHFGQLQTPAFFVHGAGDGFGTIDEMTTALTLIMTHTELLPIEGAGHELLTKRNCGEMPNTVVKAFRAFACETPA